jgi:hypothetical protein
VNKELETDVEGIVVVYSCLNSTKIPTSGRGTVSEHGMMLQVRRVRELACR